MRCPRCNKQELNEAYSISYEKMSPDIFSGNLDRIVMATANCPLCGYVSPTTYHYKLIDPPDRELFDIYDPQELENKDKKKALLETVDYLGLFIF